jgi:SNF2 family DNA or RNA helicase
MRLKEHQKRVLERFSDEKTTGLLLFHNLGSGKTITSIACCEAYPEKEKIIIVPASLQENYKKELTAMKADMSKYKVYSYEMAAKGKDELCEGKIVVVDEAHRLRNAYTGSKGVYNIIQKMKEAFKILLLTATPIVNTPYDVVPLVNAVYHLYGNPKMLPTDKKIFDQRFIQKDSDNDKPKGIITGFFGALFGTTDPDDSPKMINTDQLRPILTFVTDHYENANVNNYPAKEEKVVEVVMSKLQQKYHQKAEEEMLTEEEAKMIKKGNTEGITAKSTSRLNSFLSKTRQIVNHIAAEESSPKFEKVFEILESGLRPTVIYSNFKDSGVTRLNEMLTEKGYKCAVFSGSESSKVKKKHVEDYNKGKLDVLLITASGSEGIDLKKTRQMIILEPHWNYTRIKQAIGRGVRYLSHINLNLKNRNVTVYHLLSVYPPVYFGTRMKSSDKFLYEMTIQKEILNNQCLDLMK